MRQKIGEISKKNPLKYRKMDLAAKFLRLIFNEIAVIFLTKLQLKVNIFAAVFGREFNVFAANLFMISRL